MTANTPNYNEQGGARQVIGGSLDVESGGELDVESGAALKVAGSDVTPELGNLDGSVAGTAAAGKVATLGANKELDEVHAEKLYLGADAGTEVTATASELNTVAGVASAVGASRVTNIPLNTLVQVAALKDALPDAGDGTSLGLADDGLALVGSTTSANQKSETAAILAQLLPNYDPEEAITVVVRAKVSAAQAEAQTVDVSLKVVADGAAGSELITTDAQTLTTSFADYTFAVDETGLAASDILQLVVTGVADDTGGISAGHVEIASIEIHQTVVV